MKCNVKKTYNIDLLYKDFQKIYDNECSYNEGEFSERYLLVVFKLIDFFKVYASPKEKRDILDLLNGEW